MWVQENMHYMGAGIPHAKGQFLGLPGLLKSTGSQCCSVCSKRDHSVLSNACSKRDNSILNNGMTV